MMIPFLISVFNIQCQQVRTFFHHQSEYLHQAVQATWMKKQACQLRLLKDQELVLGGDARCDSMGHCAKFGSYCLMELTVNKILTVQLVHVRLIYI